MSFGPPSPPAIWHGEIPPRIKTPPGLPVRRGTPTPEHPKGRLLPGMAQTTPSRTGVSPSSSPRLPSPPPFTEVQFGPKSPTVGDANVDFQLVDTTQLDAGASRRVRRGATAAEMRDGPPSVELDQLESPFQLQEYLQAMYRKLTKPHSAFSTTPTVALDKDTSLMLAQPPRTSDGESVDKNLWLYELCRILTSKTNFIIVGFFNTVPKCSAVTCPEMRASEWQYLCAVHDPPKSCAAIDYCCHTLDWAGNILTSPKFFPSRLSMGGTGNDASSQQTTANSMRQLVNIFRRVYRIYAHAWFQHRDVFWKFEEKHGLYKFFKTVCDVYDLIPQDNFTIPPEAETTKEEAEEIAAEQARAETAAATAATAAAQTTSSTTDEEEQTETPVATRSPGMTERFGQLSITTNDEKATAAAAQTSSPHPDFIRPSSDSDNTQHASSTTTTRRHITGQSHHRSSPSTGAAVSTIQEGPEEDDATNAKAHPVNTLSTSTSTSNPASTLGIPADDKTDDDSISDTSSEATTVFGPDDPVPLDHKDDEDTHSGTSSDWDSIEEDESFPAVTHGDIVTSEGGEKEKQGTEGLDDDTNPTPTHEVSDPFERAGEDA